MMPALLSARRSRMHAAGALARTITKLACSRDSLGANNRLGGSYHDCVAVRGSAPREAWHEHAGRPYRHHRHDRRRSIGMVGDRGRAKAC